MILGVGVDLIEVERIARACAREAFVRRVYTQAERALFASRANAAQVMAAHWAAKEAVMKALGVGIGTVALREIEIRRNASGAPSVCLYGAAQMRLTQLHGTRLHVSLSHVAHMAAAFAVLEGEGS